MDNIHNTASIKLHVGMTKKVVILLVLAPLVFLSSDVRRISKKWVPLLVS